MGVREGYRGLPVVEVADWVGGVAIDLEREYLERNEFAVKDNDFDLGHSDSEVFVEHSGEVLKR